jgi:hypothetical protein
MPAEIFDRLVSALDALAKGQRAETAIEFQNLLASETNVAIERWQSAALGAIVERMATLPQQAQRTGRELSLAQHQLVLRHDAFETGIGRIGAAVIFVGVPSRDVVTIVRGNVPDEPLTLVAYAPNGAEIGRGQLTRDGETGVRQALIRSLNDKQPIARLELWNENGIPIRFGLADRR